jgi:energy-coupling factor transporter ATP-binding protein EcfA2
MDATEHRSAVGQLADDLRWLEEHCRQQPELAAQAGTLRLASALTRNVIGPFLEGQPPRPLHVAVVGGAGAGKSTVVNFLAGAVVAEANPQAGYTRHPTAFLPPVASFPWPSAIGFLGPLQRVSAEKPASADEDVYQVKRIPASAATTDSPLGEFVIWDCPDMTTWASVHYVSRLLEVAALADILVYVASDERYNDEVPTQFFHLLIKAGKAVVVVLTKARESDAPALVEHFKHEVLGRLPKLPDGTTPAVPVIALPQLTARERLDPAAAGARYRVPLLNQILMLCSNATATRARTVRNAARYLVAAGDSLLEFARRDLAELDAWKATVQAGKTDFETRYRGEFLSGEQFRRIDRYREELTELLELPGAGRVVGNVIWLLRAPYRWTRDYVSGLVVRPAGGNLSERTVLSAAFTGWLDQLHAEALKRAATHPLWKQVAIRFDAELSPQARSRFEELLRTFELKETAELETLGQALVKRLAGNPTLLYTLRGAKLAVDVAIIVWAVVLAVGTSWYYLLLIPVGVSLTHQVAELIVRGVVEQVRHRVRHQRETLLSTAVTGPVSGWLAEWPTSGGSMLERLQQVLRRVPPAIRQLETRVSSQLAEWTDHPPPPEPTRPGPPARPVADPQPERPRL